MKANLTAKTSSKKYTYGRNPNGSFDIPALRIPEARDGGSDKYRAQRKK